VAAFLVAVTTSSGNAAEAPDARGQSIGQDQILLLARPLLSESEQADYRARIRAAADGAERERIRAAHYDLMKARAQERGHALPETRPVPVGEPGNGFGPQWMTEEDRAAQRARQRALGIGRSAETIAPVPRGIAPEKVPEIKQRAGTAGEGAGKPEPAAVVDAASPSPQSVKAADSFLGGVVLPGIDAIFGPQLMSEEEKAAFRARLRRATSDAERSEIRAERDKQMRSRSEQSGRLPP